MIKTFDDVLKQNFTNDFHYDSDKDRFNFSISRLFNFLYENGFKMRDMSIHSTYDTIFSYYFESEKAKVDVNLYVFTGIEKKDDRLFIWCKALGVK